MTEAQEETHEFFYFCSNCVMHFLMGLNDGMYIELTTDHARCYERGCGRPGRILCIVDKKQKTSPPEQEPAPKESCKACCNMTVTEDTLFKAYKAIQQVFPNEDTAYKVVDELLNAGILFREQI